MKPPTICMGPGPCPHDACNREDESVAEPDEEEIIEIDEDGVVSAPETKAQLRTRVKALEKALGTAAQVARHEVRDLQCGEVVEQAVFHAVKAVARDALAGKGDDRAR